jgi:membrane glycosyltransferase
MVAPALVFWSLPLTLGYLVAIPFAVLTSGPVVGNFLVETGICAIPEEREIPWEIAALRAPAEIADLAPALETEAA